MSKEELQKNDDKNVSVDAGLTNAERELQADAKYDNKEVKRINYAGLIARRFFRQRSAVIGLIILGIMVLIAIFGPYVTSFNYTDADFTAINVAPNAKHWFGTDGAGIDLYACVVHGLGRSLTIGISYAILTTIISAIIGTAIAYVRGIPEKIGMWLLDGCYDCSCIRWRIWLAHAYLWSDCLWLDWSCTYYPYYGTVFT